MLNQAETQLLNALIRINTIIMAVTVGLLTAGVLWVSTTILLLRGGQTVGKHLSLISVFFPGYSVSWSGVLIGMLWAFAFGALSGTVLYWSYARTLRERLGRLLLESSAQGTLALPVFLISGNALGIGLGASLALQLLVTTNWLVVRGTAASSDNAALLSQYLPGYTVSFAGSLLGAIEIFAVAFVASHLLAAVYNSIARSRALRASSPAHS